MDEAAAMRGVPAAAARNRTKKTLIIYIMNTLIKHFFITGRLSKLHFRRNGDIESFKVLY